jgi:hypothetical protein
MRRYRVLMDFGGSFSDVVAYTGRPEPLAAESRAAVGAKLGSDRGRRGVAVGESPLGAVGLASPKRIAPSPVVLSFIEEWEGYAGWPSRVGATEDAMI